MLLYGASGHAKVIIDCLEASKVSIDGIFDDDINKKKLLEYDVLGSYDDNLLKNKEIIIAIGNNKIRKRLSDEIKHQFGQTAHPTAIIQRNVIIGEGTIVLHHAIVQSSSKIGNHVIINTKASIDHDCIIQDYVHLAPNATLCGGIVVGEGTLIGAGAVIIQNLKIGKWVTIGAGAVVIRDVPDYSVVLGNPAIIKIA
jgi:sugar O-acyltransferase (sialic acid O-acetyltransferase NeuD family)